MVLVLIMSLGFLLCTVITDMHILPGNGFSLALEEQKGQRLARTAIKS